MKRDNQDKDDKIQVTPAASNTKGKTKGRGDDEDDAELSFKKVFHGFDPEQVKSYIDELNENYLSSCRMYDRKIDENKDNITLLTRERDTLNEQIAQLKSRLAATEKELSKYKGTTDDDEEKDMSDLDAIINSLNEKITILSRENAVLKTANEKYSLEQEDTEHLKARVEQYEKAMAEITIDFERMSRAATETDSIIAEVEQLRGENKILNQKLTDAKIDLSRKTEQLTKVLPENDIMRKQVTEYDAKRSVVEQQRAAYEAENLELREANKRQAYDFAQLRNELEAKMSTERLNLIKQIQVHSYHLNQSELLLGELKKQFEQARESFKDLE